MGPEGALPLSKELIIGTFHVPDDSLLLCLGSWCLPFIFANKFHMHFSSIPYVCVHVHPIVSELISVESKNYEVLHLCSYFWPSITFSVPCI
jgi:hypothetical protein